MFRGSAVIASAVLVGLVALPGLVTAGQPRLSVCHLMGNGLYDPIEIAEPAYLTHLGHGDEQVGANVPGMGPAWVFDAGCRPVERPPVVLARAVSVDASGVEHLIARIDDTDFDGVPSAGDTLVEQEFPYFSSYLGPVAYKPFTVTRHVLTEAYAAAYTTTTYSARTLWVASETGEWSFVDQDPMGPGWWDESYSEATNDPLYGDSWWLDVTPGLPGTWGSDLVRVEGGSPGHPDVGPVYPPVLNVDGSNSTNLLDIEFGFAF